MKEIDDTPVPENESECPCCSCKYDWEALFAAWNRDRDDLRALELRIANLEVQRVANESNQDDPEWYA